MAKERAQEPGAQGQRHGTCSSSPLNQPLKLPRALAPREGVWLSAEAVGCLAGRAQAQDWQKPVAIWACPGVDPGGRGCDWAPCISPAGPRMFQRGGRKGSQETQGPSEGNASSGGRGALLLLVLTSRHAGPRQEGLLHVSRGPKLDHPRRRQEGRGLVTLGVQDTALSDTASPRCANPTAAEPESQTLGITPRGLGAPAGRHGVFRVCGPHEDSRSRTTHILPCPAHAGLVPLDGRWTLATVSGSFQDTACHVTPKFQAGSLLNAPNSD